MLLTAYINQLLPTFSIKVYFERGREGVSDIDKLDNQILDGTYILIFFSDEAK